MLEKATITELSPDGSTTAGDPVPVQFNPATMKLQLSNSTEGGKSRGRQTRQFLGTSSTVLTVELVFDTADEDNGGQPRSVRDRTNFIEKYVLPEGQGKSKQAPPKLRFHWGPLILDGLLDNVAIDIDHFAEDGTPLRAKVGLSIKEQNSSYQFQAYSAPAATGPSNSSGDTMAGQPGSTAGPSTQSATTIGGETAADFAARNGLDPTAWRGLDFGTDSPLSLSAGLDVGFSADLSVSAGLGVTVGFEAGVTASLNASLGLDVSASVGLSGSASLTASASAGFAVSSAGGVSAAIAQVQNAGAAMAVQQTAQAFQQSLPAGAGAAVQATSAAALASPAPPQLGPPSQTRTPLQQTGLPTLSQQAAAPAAPAPPQVDARATSFGFGVPLRTQLGSGSTQRANVTAGSVALGGQVGSGNPPMTTNPTIPPWVALPASEFTVDSAGAAQLKRRPQPSCGCSSRPCGCGRHA